MELHCGHTHNIVIYYIYVHKADAQCINIKRRAWPQARLALAEYMLTRGRVGIQVVYSKFHKNPFRGFGATGG